MNTYSLLAITPLSVLAALTLAGCSTPLGPQHIYPEPRRHVSELALVRSGLPQYRDPGCPVVGSGTITILAVDSRPTFQFPIDPPRSVYVLPGGRVITVKYITGPREAGDFTASDLHTFYSGEAQVKLDIRPGDIFRLDRRIDTEYKRFSIIPVRQSPTDCWAGDK